MKREFGPQNWSPEVTKSAEIVHADGILRHKADTILGWLNTHDFVARFLSHFY